MESEENQATSEFEATRWSVLSFDDCAASNLTYAAAAEFVEKLRGKISGLCVVTDEAASRIYKAKTANTNQNGCTPDVNAPQIFSDLL